MGKPKLFVITFNHPQCLYTPGDVVTGEVTLELATDMKMRGVRLELNGKAVVRWTEGSQKHRRIYSAVQTYFDESIGLMGSRDDSQVVKPGTYKYPFTFNLPRNLPASFKSLVGNINYSAKAVIDIPFGFDHTVTMDMIILPFLDLNREPVPLRQPSLVQKHEDVSCCGSSGTVAVDLTVNRLCFVPGETIYINGTVKNDTNTEIKNTKVLLLQNLQFHAAGRHHTWTWNEIGSAWRPAIEAGATDRIENLPLIIPPTPPSRLDGCEIIDIIYHLKFVVTMRCDKIVLDTNVIIGTVPLQGTYQPVTQQPLNPSPFTLPPQQFYQPQQHHPPQTRPIATYPAAGNSSGVQDRDTSLDPHNRKQGSHDQQPRDQGSRGRERAEVHTTTVKDNSSSRRALDNI